MKMESKNKRNGEAFDIAVVLTSRFFLDILSPPPPNRLQPPPPTSSPFCSTP